MTTAKEIIEKNIYNLYFELGWDSFHKNVPRKENPYESGSMEFNAWDSGWTASKSEIE